MKKSLFLPFSLLVLTVLSLSFYACSDDDDDKDEQPTPSEETATGSLTVKFHHYVGDKELTLGSETYANSNGDEFTASQFRYYISNIVLDGNEAFTEEESYHLISQTEDQITKEDILVDEIKIEGIKTGDYSALDFGIGVDAGRNTEGAQVGALDPVNGMFWNWNIGYIFFKLEGLRVPNDLGNITYHIGGDEAYRTTSLPLNGVTISENQETTIDVKVDLAKAFDAKTVVKLDEFSATMSPGDNANMLADNYREMFSVLEK